MKKTTIKDATPDTRLLYQKLSTMKVGDFVSYADLTSIIDRDVQHEGRGFLMTARKMCARDDQKLFGVVINEGLKCLSDSEIVNTAHYAITHIKRTSRSSMKKLGCIQDISELPNDERIKLNTYASVLGVFATMAKGNNIRKIEAKVAETEELLPYAKTLEAFK